MPASTTTASQSQQSMSVNVRLCGSIPRRDMLKDNEGYQEVQSLRGTTPCGFTLTSSKRLSRLAATNGCGSEPSTLHKSLCDGLAGILSNHNLDVVESENIVSKDNNMTINGRSVLSERQTVVPSVFDPPSWAVPAKGEARLEPVCEALGRQSSVDLTSRSFYRVGRSPNCDVQLMHCTSSRRHAMLFHHSNGSCYVVDCGSAHGTYVNGVRVASPAVGGAVIPYKVRRGAIVRFGGPGAPCFVLKSFNFQLDDLKDQPSDSNQDMSAVVRRNTRLNALGRTAADSVRNSLSATIFKALWISNKRSFESLSSATLDEDEKPSNKRMRCSSPPLSPEVQLRLVSPDISHSSKLRRVHFSPEPPQSFYSSPVTPDDLSSDEDN